MTTENLPQWNLDDLYKSPEATKPDLEKLKTLCATFAKTYEGKLDTANLATAIAEYEAICDLISKIGSYASLLFAVDMLDDKVAAFYQNINDAISELQSTLVFFTLGLNKLPDDKVFTPALAKYKPWLMDLRLSKPYQLSDELEKFDIEKAASQSWSRLFDETHANLTYDFDGEKLTNAEIFNKFYSADRAVREKAGRAVAKTLGDNIKLFALITNTLAKDKQVEDKWRGYKSPITSRNISNLVEDEVVSALINTVKQNYPKLAHRYYALKAKWLGLEKLEFWDRNAPLPNDDKEYIPYQTAIDITLGAFGEFSPELAKIGKEFFDKPWVDAQPRKGKDSGAFAHPVCVSAHPYLMVNYQGKIKDVMTLAHELGHGVHQYLSRTQGPLMSDTPLTLAETASVFGEQLVFRKLLNAETNPQAKKIMLAGKVEDMLNTVVRQIAFVEFERKVHEGRKNGELSAEQIGEFWMQVQTESLGSIFNFEKGYEHFWSYIPHFIHTPFYVYSYAFGDCLVNSLYAVYLKSPNGFENKYLELLRAGGSKRHKELLAPFGLDAGNINFWQQGIDIIDSFITELESSK